MKRKIIEVKAQDITLDRGVMNSFSIIFILYEAVSILKNMLLCGLQVPKKLRDRLESFIDVK